MDHGGKRNYDDAQLGGEYSHPGKSQRYDQDGADMLVSSRPVSNLAKLVDYADHTGGLDLLPIEVKERLEEITRMGVVRTFMPAL